MFATAYPESEVPSIRYHSHRIEQIRGPLVDYIEPAMSVSVANDWMTCLSLEMTAFRTVELVNLSGLKNLEALHLMAYGTTPDDQQEHLLRYWNRIGPDEQVFPALRILILRGWREISRQNLRFLAAFRALQFFAQDDCTVRRPEDDIRVRGVTYRHVATHSCSGPRLIRELVQQRGVTSKDGDAESSSPARPSLHLQLGVLLRSDDAVVWRNPPPNLQLYQREKKTVVAVGETPRGVETQAEADADTGTSAAPVSIRPPPPSSHAKKRRKEDVKKTSVRSSKRLQLEDILGGFQGGAP